MLYNLSLHALHQRTLLFGAAKRGHKDTVVYLVGRGADISLRDTMGVSMHVYVTTALMILFSVNKCILVTEKDFPIVGLTFS